LGAGKILLVDDEDVVRTTTKLMLTRLGYSVISFDNGIDSISYYAENMDSIDLVVLDMIMPKMSGKECFYELQKINPAVKAVVVSGYSKDTDIEELKTNGLLGFLTKPVHIDELSKLCGEVLL